MTVGKIPSKQLGSPPLVRIMDCALTVAIDDFVYPSSIANNRAVKATTDNTTNPVIGIVRAKPTTTTCEALLVGIHAYTINRGKIWLSSSGGLTLVRPTSPTYEYIQELGWSFGDGYIFINPNLMRIKLS